MSIKTDSTPVEAPKPPQGALYELLKVMAPEQDWPGIEQSWKAGGKGYGDYKKKLIEYFHATFSTARARYQELKRDPGEVERVLLEGARRARMCAAPVMEAVRGAVGIPKPARIPR